MPPSNNHRVKSTTSARDFANTPPYSPAKTPTRTYGKKGRGRLNHPSETATNTPQSQALLAYEDLIVAPETQSSGSSQNPQTEDSDDEIIFVSVRYTIQLSG